MSKHERGAEISAPLFWWYYPIPLSGMRWMHEGTIMLHISGNCTLLLLMQTSASNNISHFAING